MKKEIYSGKAVAHFETGMEGIEWSVELNEAVKGKSFHYDVIVPINTGDHLKIFDSSNQLVFDSIVVRDRQSNRHSYMTGISSSQVADGYWCRWLQHGYNPSDWGRLFRCDHTVLIEVGAHSKEDVKKFLAETQSYDSSRTKLDIVMCKNRVCLIHEKPEFVLNSFTDYTNDVDDKGDVFFNRDKFDLSMYSPLVVGLMMQYTENCGDDLLFIESKIPVTENLIREYDGMPDSEDLTVLVGDNEALLFSEDDYLPEDILNHDGLLSKDQVKVAQECRHRMRTDFSNDFNKKKVGWNWFSYKFEGSILYGAFVRVTSR